MLANQSPIDERYDRQARIVQVIDEQPQYWDQQGIFNSRVLVVGIGNIGVRLAVALAEVGFIFLDLLDSDKVSRPNLSRGGGLFQAEDIGEYKARVVARRLQQINPQIRARAIVADVRFEFGLARFGEYDLILLATHDLSSRRHVNQFVHLFPGRTKALIDGGISELSFSLQTILPGKTPCYSCTLPADNHDPESFQGCNGVVSEVATAPAATNGLDGMAVAALMAKEAALIAARLQPFFAGREFRFEGDGAGRAVRILRNAWGGRCSDHEPADLGRVLTLPYGPSTRVSELRAMVATQLDAVPNELYITPIQLTTARAICGVCEAALRVMRPQKAPLALNCSSCGNQVPGLFHLEFVRDLTETATERTLADYGLLVGQALSCWFAGEQYFLMPEVLDEEGVTDAGTA